MRASAVSWTLFLSVMLCGAPPTPSAPDLVLFHAKVFTADINHEWAQALAIKENKILAVGTNETILALCNAGTRRIDSGGRVIVPGFNDAHIHIEARLPSYFVNFRSPDPSWNDIVDALSRVADHQPRTEILRANIGRTAFMDPRANRESLDRLLPNRPVYLETITNNGVVINSAYMHQLRLGDEEPDPPLGQYDRVKGAARLTGRLTGLARFYVSRREELLARREQDIRTWGDLLHKGFELGITSMQIMPAGGATEAAAMLVASKTPLRVREIFRQFTHTECTDDYGTKIATWEASDHVYLSGCKWHLDGTPLEFSAALTKPYPEFPSRIGDLNFTDQQVNLILRSAEAHHEQLLFHAIGDRAVEQLLRALEAYPEADWPSKRVRIEHGDGIRVDQIDRLKRLGVIVVINPTHLLPLPSVPTDTMKNRFEKPVRTLLKSGVSLAIGSDGEPNPFRNIMCASDNPFKPEESITREEAVIAHTYGSAFAEFREQEKGRLLPAQLADFAVLSQDIFEIDSKRLPDTRSVLTMINGKIVYDSKTLATEGSGKPAR